MKTLQLCSFGQFWSILHHDGWLFGCTSVCSGWIPIFSHWIPICVDWIPVFISWITFEKGQVSIFSEVAHQKVQTWIANSYFLNLCFLGNKAPFLLVLKNSPFASSLPWLQSLWVNSPSKNLIISPSNHPYIPTASREFFLPDGSTGDLLPLVLANMHTLKNSVTFCC